MSRREDSEADRRTATIVGILFIIATVFYLLGGAIYGPSLDSSDFLEEAYPDRGMVRLGVLIEFTCVLAIPLIGVLLFPVLRRFNEALAVAYVVFRSLEAVFLFGIEAKLLSLIDVSEDYLDGGRTDTARFQAIGDAVLAEIDGAFAIYVLVFAVGALLLYSMLYSSRLVPRWLAAWGFASAVLMLGGTALVVFGAFSGAAAEAVIVLPLAVNEMVLAGWLILRGFNSAAITSEIS